MTGETWDQPKHDPERWVPVPPVRFPNRFKDADYAVSNGSRILYVQVKDGTNVVLGATRDLHIMVDSRVPSHDRWQDAVAHAASESAKECAPWLCRWLPRLLPAPIRERVFDPAYQDMSANFGGSARSSTRFVVATAWLVMLSWSTVINGKVTAALAKLVPAAVREW